MTNNAQEHISIITNKGRIRYLDISNRDLSDSVDLKEFKEFTALKSFNSYNNKFENIAFLDSLPQKDKSQNENNGPKDNFPYGLVIGEE